MAIRQIGKREFFSLAFGTIIGVGWITLLGFWLADAGSVGTTIAFVIGMVLFLPVGLCYAEMTGIYPYTGGPIVYALNEFGIRTAFFAGWMLILVFLFTVVFEAISVAWLMDTIWPGSKGPRLYSFMGADIHAGHVVVGIGLNLFLCFSNLRGGASAGHVQNVTVLLLVLIVAVLVCTAATMGSVENLSPFFAKDRDGHVFTGIAAVIVTVPFMLSGFETIAQGAGERDESVSPAQVATIIVLSIVGAAIFYVAVVLAASYIAPREALLNAELATARAFEIGLGSSTLMKVVLTAGMLGLLSTWNSSIFACARVFVTMSRIGLIWRGFSRINNAGVSVHGVLFIAIAGALGTLLGRSAVMPLVESSSMALGATFLVVCLSAIHSRRKYPDLKRPYKMKFGLLLPLLGVGAAVSTLILAGSGLYSPDTAVPLELLLFLGLLLLGLGLWFLSTSSRRSHTVQELRVLIAEDR